jgi:hypothetical protein
LGSGLKVVVEQTVRPLEISRVAAGYAVAAPAALFRPAALSRAPATQQAIERPTRQPFGRVGRSIVSVRSLFTRVTTCRSAAHGFVARRCLGTTSPAQECPTRTTGLPMPAITSRT